MSITTEHPAVQKYMDEARQEFEASMARIAQAWREDETVPADLEPHVTPTGGFMHELGWWLCGWPLGVLFCVVAAYLLAVD